VTAHYRSSAASLLPLTASHDSTRLHIAQANLSSETAVADLFAALPHPVEVLVVNHAVYAGAAHLKDMSLVRWRATLDDNLTSSFLVVRAYLRALEAGIAQPQEAKEDDARFGDRAAIVLVGSTAGKFGEASNADYAASKSGACAPPSLIPSPQVCIQR
jgi:NAD(P)-dependent dehydrogenase (short-subunit alcohol dehydrogenase family)